MKEDEKIVQIEMKKVVQINKGGQNSSWAKNKTEARPLGIEGTELREGNM